MSVSEILSYVLGILGLIASLAGLYLSYVTYVNPLVRFKWYLRNPSGWEKFMGVEKLKEIYRYKNQPNFQIVIDWDTPLVDGFKEEWVMDYPWRDEDNNSSHTVRFEVNGMVLQTETFVALDGIRYFIPLPRVQMNGDERLFYYDSLQFKLANIIGKYHFYKDLREFSSAQKNLFINEYL